MSTYQTGLSSAKYKTLVTEAWSQGTCSYDVHAMPMMVEKTTVLKLTPEHRVRPTPLDLTSRDVQSTLVQIARVHTWRSYMGWQRCPGTSDWFHTFRDYRSADLPGFSVWNLDGLTLPATNWQLAMALKIQDDKVSFAETLGEYREAVAAFKGGVNIIARSYRVAKDLLRTRRSRRSYTRAFARIMGRKPHSRWELQDAVSMDLAITYGITPNVDLLLEIIERLKRAAARKRRLQVTLTSDAALTRSDENGGHVYLEGERSDRAIAYVVYDVDSPEFTAGNIAEAAWAGIPLSFVVDMFLDVGSYLSSLNAMRGVESFEMVLCTRLNVTKVDETLGTMLPINETVGRCTYSSFERVWYNNLPAANFPTLGLPPSGSYLGGVVRSLVEILFSFRNNMRRAWHG